MAAMFPWICAGLALGTLATRAGADDDLMPRRAARPVTFGAIVVPEIYAVDVMAPMDPSECRWVGPAGCELGRFDHVVGLGPWPVRVCCQADPSCDSPKSHFAWIGSTKSRIICQEEPELDFAASLTTCTDGQGACQTAACDKSACDASGCDASACATKCASGNSACSAKRQGLTISIPACEELGEAGSCFTFSCSTEGRESEDGCQAGGTAKCFTHPLFGGKSPIILQRVERKFNVTACSEGNCKDTACCPSEAAGCEVACQTAACDESACAEACANKCTDRCIDKCASDGCRRAKQRVAIAVPACPAQRPVASHAVLSDCGSPDAPMTDIRAMLAAQIEAIENNAACATNCLPSAAAPTGDSVPAIGTLRHAAQALEQAACELEDQELYARADQLRGIAAELRHDARGDRRPPISGVNVQVITPMAAPDSLPHELERLHEQLLRVRKAMGAHREPRLH